MDFATVYSDFNLMEAQLVRSRLEAAGFHPFVKNELSGGFLSGYGNSPANMISVQVPEVEAAEVRAFLDSSSDSP